jgi:hypothetical protein
MCNGKAGKEVLREVRLARKKYTSSIGHSEEAKAESLSKKGDFKKSFIAALKKLEELNDLLTLAAITGNLMGNLHRSAIIGKCIKAVEKSGDPTGFKTILDSQNLWGGNEYKTVVFAAWVEMEGNVDELWNAYYGIMLEFRINKDPKNSGLPKVGKAALLKIFRLAESDEERERVVKKLHGNYVRMIKNR